jgi:hypothetical protein
MNMVEEQNMEQTQQELPSPKKSTLISGFAFYTCVAAFVAADIYCMTHLEEIKKSLKPTFELNTPWGTAEIKTPWGNDAPVAPQIYTAEASNSLNLEPIETTNADRRARSPSKILKCVVDDRVTYQNTPCERTNIAK